MLVILPTYQVPYMDKVMAELDREGLTSSSGEAGALGRLKHRAVTDAAFINAFAIYTSANPPILLTDDELNALFVLDVPSATSRACQALETLDCPTPQVRMQLTMYEVSMQNDGRLGLDFQAWKNGPGRNLFAVGAFIENESASTLTNTTRLLPTGLAANTTNAKGANFAMQYDVPSAFFDFLVSRGKAQISAETKVAVLHNNAATLQTTDTIFYHAVTNAQVADVPNAAYRANVQADGTNWFDGNAPRAVTTDTDTRQALNAGALDARDTGVWVNVTPSIGSELVNLDINFRIINHLGFDDEGLPLVARRTSETEVKAEDGKEIVLGGLVHETYLNSTNKIPVLGSIPGLGYLFGGESKNTLKRMVVLVVQPEVLRGEFKGITTPEQEFCTECSRCDITTQ